MLYFEAIQFTHGFPQKLLEITSTEVSQRQESKLSELYIDEYVCQFSTSVGKMLL